VLVDRLASSDFDQVGVDNQSAIYQLVDHLVVHGYRHIALVPGHDGYSTTGERMVSFSDRMEHHGLAAMAQITSPSNSSDAACAHVAALLSGPTRPDALVTGNNLSTIGAMRAIRQSRLRVPEDIALVGIDDFEWADSFEPRLTVIAQPCQSIGQKAAALMRARIKAPAAPTSTLQLEPQLILRNSCGCKV
jgi:LacI family transcriptional regulator